MSNPIVVDCGGSTRIKTILAGGGFGDMNSLLDVGDLAAPLPGTGPLPAGVSGSQHKANGPYANFSIVFQDAAGVPFSIPVAPFPNNFVIVSNGGQSVRGDFAAGGATVILTIYGGADPLVEAKQNRIDKAPKGRRRYIVTNAGPIRTVTINGAAAPVFDASAAAGPPPAPPVAVGAVGPAGGPAAPAAGAPLYVSVVFS
jgi:hypothetical protein